MPIYLGDNANNAKHVAEQWVAGEIDTFPLGAFVLGREIFLYRGGQEAFTTAQLEPQYCVVRRLYAGREAVGYVTYMLNQSLTCQVADVMIIEKACGRQTCILALFGRQGYEHKHHDLLSNSSIPSRFAAVADCPPKRVFPALSTNDAVHIVASERSDGVVEFLRQIGSNISPEHQKILAERWHEGNTRQRLGDIMALFAAAHYSSYGTPVLHAHSPTWPFDEPTFPCLEDREDYDLGLEIDQVAVANLMQHFTFGAKLIRLDARQDKALEERLLNLGVAENTLINRADSSPWTGRVQDGRELLCTGTIFVGDCRIHTVHSKGGLVIGHAAYIGDSFKDYLGDITAQLWKAHNHAGFLVPEEQRGVGLIVSQ